MFTFNYSFERDGVPQRLCRGKWCLFALLPLLIFCFYLLCLNHLEPHEFGIVRSRLTSNMWTQHAGWHLTAPWASVSVIDTRPMRVSVDSSGRSCSAKLVQFVPEEWEEFIKTEGFRYYWWSNRISFNLGYEEENRGMRDLMRGYAYGAKKYKFIRVLNEYQQ